MKGFKLVHRFYNSFTLCSPIFIDYFLQLLLLADLTCYWMTNQCLQMNKATGYSISHPMLTQVPQPSRKNHVKRNQVFNTCDKPKTSDTFVEFTLNQMYWHIWLFYNKCRSFCNTLWNWCHPWIHNWAKYCRRQTTKRSKLATKLQRQLESSAIPSSMNDKVSEGEAILDAAINTNF